MSNKESMRELSRLNYTTDALNVTNDDLQTGCLLRIADAQEKIAGNWSALVRDLEHYRAAYGEHQDKIKELRAEVRMLRRIVRAHAEPVK